MSILDHVVSAVPRTTVYGALKGTNVFTGKYYRELYPASNSSSYNYSKEPQIKFIIASPSKTAFFDMRSCYLKFEIDELLINVVAAKGPLNTTDQKGAEATLSEPVGTAWIKRLVVKCNGSVIEDLNFFNTLTAFFKRKIMTRSQKNAHPEDG